jgi:hypothetical protein
MKCSPVLSPETKHEKRLFREEKSILLLMKYDLTIKNIEVAKKNEIVTLTK